MNVVLSFPPQKVIDFYLINNYSNQFQSYFQNETIQQASTFEPYALSIKLCWTLFSIITSEANLPNSLSHIGFS